MEFSELPENLIVEILRHLDGKHILVARQVCKQWAYIVSENAELRNKNFLLLQNTTINDQGPFMQAYLKSPYFIPSKIEFVNVVFGYSFRVEALWGKMGPQLEQLSVTLGLEHNVVNFFKLLRRSRKLKKLYISLYCFQETEIYGVDYFNRLRSLEKVKIYCFNCSRFFINLARSVNETDGLISLKVQCNRLAELTEMEKVISRHKSTLKSITLICAAKKNIVERYLKLNGVATLVQNKQSTKPPRCLFQYWLRNNPIPKLTYKFRTNSEL